MNSFEKISCVSDPFLVYGGCSTILALISSIFISTRLEVESPKEEEVVNKGFRERVDRPSDNVIDPGNELSGVAIALAPGWVELVIKIVDAFGVLIMVFGSAIVSAVMVIKISLN